MASNTCDKECINAGIKNLGIILKKPLEDLIGLLKISTGDLAFLSDFVNTFKCNLPADLLDLIEADFNSIKLESSNIVSKVNLLYIVTIYVTLLILIIFIYLTIYFNNNTYTLLFAILSVIVLIIGAVVLFFGLNYIYSNSTTLISTRITHIIDIFTNASKQALCCSGQCIACIKNC